MKFKALLIATMAVSAFLFPASAHPRGHAASIDYYSDATYQVQVGRRGPGGCGGSWGITSSFPEYDFCAE